MVIQGLPLEPQLFSNESFGSTLTSPIFFLFKRNTYRHKRHR
jgi:hypothetical protein